MSRQKQKRSCHISEMLPTQINQSMATSMKLLVAILSLLTMSSSVRGQESAVVAEKPTYKVGDTWTYNRFQTTRENLNPVTPTWTRTIVDITPEGNLVTGGAGQTLYDSSFNPLSENGPGFHRKLFVFPMKVGDSWSNSRRMNPNNQLIEYSEFKVVAYEKIKIPAGSFDCFHIVGDTRIDMKTQGFWNQIDRWYCPTLRAMGKEVITFNERNSYNPSIYNIVTSELASSSYPDGK